LLGRTVHLYRAGPAQDQRNSTEASGSLMARTTVACVVQMAKSTVPAPRGLKGSCCSNSYMLTPCVPCCLLFALLCLCQLCRAHDHALPRACAARKCTVRCYCKLHPVGCVAARYYSPRCRGALSARRSCVGVASANKLLTAATQRW
jgi:hypothetical protein